MNATQMHYGAGQATASGVYPDQNQSAGRQRGLNLLRGSAIYLLIGVLLGVFMGATGDHTLRSVHTHLNLFGWASLALMGLIYLAMPQLALTGLARVHVVLHHAGLLSMMLGLAGKLYGYAGAEPLLGLGSVIAAVAIALFAGNFLRYGRAS